MRKKKRRNKTKIENPSSLLIAMNPLGILIKNTAPIKMDN